MEYIFFTVGLCVGVLVYRSIWFRFLPSGVIEIDDTNPDRDIYKFSINEPEVFYNLSKTKVIIFKVVPKSKLSQK